MNNNKIVIYITIIALIIIVGIPTIVHVVNNYYDKLYKITVCKIETAANKCIEEEKCLLEEKITLKELYENNYLEKLANPRNKEYFNESSYIIIKNNNYEFVEE